MKSLTAITKSNKTPAITQIIQNRHLATYCLKNQEAIQLQLDLLSFFHLHLTDRIQDTIDVNKCLYAQQMISKLDLLTNDGQQLIKRLVKSGKRFALLSTNQISIQNKWITDFEQLKIELDLFETMCRNAKAMAWKQLRNKSYNPRSPRLIIASRSTRLMSA